eukprot:1143067-Pelagomonas_calceolata.AAC.1
MKTPAILSLHQFACILKKRWKNGIKSRGGGGIDTRNMFGHNFIQLTRVWKMERLKMRGSRNRTGMKISSKFIGASVVQTKLCKLVQGMISIAGPTNTQKDSVETRSHDLSTNEFAEVCMLSLCRLQLLSRPHVFTVLNFNQVHMLLVDIQLVRRKKEKKKWFQFIRSNEYSIRTTRCESRPLRKITWKKIWGYNSVGRMCKKFVLRRPIITSNVHVNQACSTRAFAKSFDDHSSSNIAAFNFHAGDDMILAA